jgi:hypothetical protein
MLQVGADHPVRARQMRGQELRHRRSRVLQLPRQRQRGRRHTFRGTRHRHARGLPDLGFSPLDPRRVQHLPGPRHRHVDQPCLRRIHSTRPGLVRRRGEPVPDPHALPLAPLGLVHRRYHDPRLVLVDHLFHVRDDLLRPVGVDPDRLQLGRRGVLFGVLLHLAPGRGQEQLTVRRPSTRLEIDRRLSNVQQRLTAPAGATGTPSSRKRSTSGQLHRRRRCP